uniref:Uncharacterized protein n=1 Tax=Anguilla anguilla TaxID=7936 RepID=A0A0E9XL15_ANGAN
MFCLYLFIFILIHLYCRENK